MGNPINTYEETFQCALLFQANQDMVQSKERQIKTGLATLLFKEFDTKQQPVTEPMDILNVQTKRKWCQLDKANRHDNQECPAQQKQKTEGGHRAKQGGSGGNGSNGNKKSESRRINVPTARSLGTGR